MIAAMVIFKNVYKKYAKELGVPVQNALSDLNFSLNEGETLGLIGANGAGKSTSIRLIMGFIRPTKGTISLFGQTNAELSVRSQIGYLPETASFPANLTILDLIHFTAATCGIDIRTCQERSQMLLHDLGLWEARRKRLRSYSKGMQQRANFILALLNDPELLILDEPMSGLDPIGRGQIIELIQRLKSKGKTILFCSHILGDVDRLADQLLVLDKGQSLFSGQPQDFVASEKSDSIEAAYLALINRHRERLDNAA